MTEGNTFINALIGAVVSIVTAFTGVGPIVGGVAAGYLNQRDGLAVGGLSGLLTAIPFVLFLVVFGSFFAALPFAAGMSHGPAMMAGSVGIVAVVFMLLMMLVYTVGLGALGGYLGVYLYDEDVL